MSATKPPKLSPVQRAVLTALAAEQFVPVRGGNHYRGTRCTPATAIKLHELGLVETAERLRWREGRERSVITSVAITEAGRAVVAAAGEG